MIARRQGSIILSFIARLPPQMAPELAKPRR